MPTEWRAAKWAPELFKIDYILLTLCLKVVDDDSASLGCANERKWWIPANHSDMCKFKEIGYRRVPGALSNLVQDASQTEAIVAPQQNGMNLKGLCSNYKIYSLYWFHLLMYAVWHTAVVRTQEHPQLVLTQGSIKSQTYSTYSSTVPDHQSGIKTGIGPRLIGASQVD